MVGTSMKNMKIEVNAEQPIDEIVMELERLGFSNSPLDYKNCTVIGIYPDYMKYDCYKSLNIDGIVGCEITTLPELKEM